MGLLGRVDVEALARAELTYRECGATRGSLPPGYAHVHRTARIGTGTSTFYRAVDALIRWEMHRRVGLSVVSAPPVADLGSVVVFRLGPPVIGFLAPCRVVYLVDEPDRGGFAYGTLPGHPECGEEAFVVELKKDRGVDVTIRSFSRPSALLARAGGPFTRLIQALLTDRYVRTLRQLGQPSHIGPGVGPAEQHEARRSG